MPEVIDGYRAPRAQRNEEASAAAAQRGSGDAVIPDGKVVFQAVAQRYRRQLTAPEEVKRSDGTVKRDRALVAMFDGGLLTLDPKKPEQAETIKRLREDEFYGRDFWDFADVLAAAQKRKVEEAEKSLNDIAASPEGRKRLMEALKASGADDFEMPAGSGKQAQPSK